MSNSDARTVEHSSTATARSLATAYLALSILGVGTNAFAKASPSASEARAPQLSDPIGYCKRMKNDDRFGIPATDAVVDSLGLRLRKALGLSSDAPLPAASVYWRCMDATTYVCFIGANLPCAARADRSTFNAGAAQYCRSNPDAADVPSYATGHDTVYSWKCHGRKSIRGSAVSAIDHRGYRSDIWHPLK